MRLLYRFIKTEFMLTVALIVIAFPLMFLVLDDFFPLPLYLKTFASVYISMAMHTPFHYFDSDVRRRRIKPGYVPLDETKSYLKS